MINPRLNEDEDPDQGIGSDSVSTKAFVSPVLSWTEKEFQEQVMLAAKQLGWSLRYHTFNSKRSAKGFPDLVLVHPAKSLVLFRELKTEKGKTTAEQDEWVSALAGAGQDAGVWRPSDWVSGQVQAELNQSVVYLDVLPDISKFRAGAAKNNMQHIEWTADDHEPSSMRTRLKMWGEANEPGN